MGISEQPVIEGWRGVMVAAGLGTPAKRAVTVVLAVGALAYTFKYPNAAFRPDGTMRPATATGSRAADATDRHFLLIPLAAGVLTYVFT